MTVPAEVEAKLLVPQPAQLDAIARLQQIASHPLRERGTVRLHSIYLDTRELALARQGIALRLRQQDKHWELTGKWAGRIAGVLHERPELTVQLGRVPRQYRVPAGPLQCRLAAIIAGRPLRPILVTDIVRQRFDVLPKRGAGEPVAELALDSVRLVAPARDREVATYCEVEIELRHGTRREVSAMATALRRQLGLVPSPHSKFARGLALLYGAGAPRTSSQESQYHNDHLTQQLQRLRELDAQMRCSVNATTLRDMRATVGGIRAGVHALGTARSRHLLDNELSWFAGLLKRVHEVHADRNRCWKQLLRAMRSARYFHLLVRLERHCAKGQPRGAGPG